MQTNLNLDHPAYGCEIVIPIVVKIPFYIEPVVLEQPPNCDLAQPSSDDLSAAAAVPETVEPTASKTTLKQPPIQTQPQTQLNLVPIKPSWFHWLQSLLSYVLPEPWNRIRNPSELNLINKRF